MRRYAGEFAWAGSVQISSAVEPFAMQGMPQVLAGPLGSVLEWAVARTPRFAEGVRRAVTRSLAPVLLNRVESRLGLDFNDDWSADDGPL